MDRIKVMELVRSYQVGEIPRRDFLKKGAAAVGSLAAANSLLVACAQFPNDNPPPVVDESQPAASVGLEEAGELTAGVVEYPGPNGKTLMGYLAQPSAASAQKAVIVIQEWWGLNDHIKDVVRRFAEAGFAALAPDLYDGQVTTEPDEARKLAMELDTAAAVAEIGSAIDYLTGLDTVEGDKAGIVGFCMGGGLVAQSALSLSNMGAGAVFYGRPLSTEEAKTVTAPMLGFIGTNDGITVESMEAMHAGFAESGLPNELHVYEGAQHSFFNDTRASYDADASADAWTRTLNWFNTHL
ncbi:MAG: dienelactone hydrolase family protein [Ardenticatenaceae bacterium]|nr:dienelactone hydrolase family protein [Ardenticatenaceae bacterium]